MELIFGLVFIVAVILILMLPAWVGLMAYDYIAAQVDWTTLEVTFLNVLCIAVVLGILRGIFSANKNK